MKAFRKRQKTGEKCPFNPKNSLICTDFAADRLVCGMAVKIYIKQKSNPEYETERRKTEARYNGTRRCRCAANPVFSAFFNGLHAGANREGVNIYTHFKVLEKERFLWQTNW